VHRKLNVKPDKYAKALKLLATDKRAMLTKAQAFGIPGWRPGYVEGLTLEGHDTLWQAWKTQP